MGPRENNSHECSTAVRVRRRWALRMGVCLSTQHPGEGKEHEEQQGKVGLISPINKMLGLAL